MPLWIRRAHHILLETGILGKPPQGEAQPPQAEVHETWEGEEAQVDRDGYEAEVPEAKEDYIGL